MDVPIKRVYETPLPSDGQWVLVDRLWPRGIAKTKIGLWKKDVAPSTELREWFHHDPERWIEFKKRYRAELRTNAAFGELKALARGTRITLVYAAKDELHNEAVVLKQMLARNSAVSRRGGAAS